MAHPTTETAKRLAAELRKLGLEEMAVKAEANHYDDFFSESPAPISLLLHDLTDVAGIDSKPNRGVLKLRRRVLGGEFDGTEEEGYAWANSPEGREVLG
jgi:predicted nucleic acid-binding OB-fold protein